MMKTWFTTGSRARALLSCLVAIACVGALATTQAQANDPFEPNEWGGEAAGPLVLNKTVVGTVSASDRDYFKFYVAKRGRVSFEVSVPAECGDLCRVTAIATDEATVGVKILARELAGTQTISSVFPPGRYYLIINSADQYLDSPNPIANYTVKPTAGISTWAQMKAACAAAKKPIKKALKKVNSAKKALARAKKKGKGVAKAKRALNRAKKQLAAARSKSTPICSIKP